MYMQIILTNLIKMYNSYLDAKFFNFDDKTLCFNLFCALEVMAILLCLLVTVRESILSSQFGQEKNILILLLLFHFMYFTALVLLAKLCIILVCFFMHYRPWQFYDVSYGQRIHFEFQRTQQLIN